MTTLQPRPPYSPEELTKLYPNTLELQQVQILLRHGERTPVNARFKNAGLPVNWPYCTAANALRSAIKNADGGWSTLQWKRRMESLGQGDVPSTNKDAKGGVESICQPGELTDKGRETTLALGQRTRQLYVDQLGFLPPTLDAAATSNIYLRSSPIPRALESLQQAFTGLYPPSTRSAGLPPPPVVQREMRNETLFPNESACPRFAELARAFAARTAELYNDGPELNYINKKIGKWMPPDSPVVKVDSHPRLSGVMDSVNASLAHGQVTKLPSEFYDPKVRQDVDRICTEEWFAGYTESNEYRKIGIGGLIGDLTQRMVEHVRGTSTHSSNAGNEPFKISLAGCHDTTIAASLASLGAFDVEKDTWPNFTSSIAFELFKKKREDAPSGTAVTGAVWPSKEKTWWYSLFSSPSPSPTSKAISARSPLVEWSQSDKSKLEDYYVRLRYNDNPVTLPACKPTEKHFENDESFCTLKAFKEATDSFTPKDWRKECGMHMGEPAMKPMIERPPGL